MRWHNFPPFFLNGQRYGTVCRHCSNTIECLVMRQSRWVNFVNFVVCMNVIEFANSAAAAVAAVEACWNGNSNEWCSLAHSCTCTFVQCTGGHRFNNNNNQRECNPYHHKHIHGQLVWLNSCVSLVVVVVVGRWRRRQRKCDDKCETQHYDMSTTRRHWPRQWWNIHTHTHAHLVKW